MSLFKSMDKKPETKLSPVFIVSSGRSGTTLLRGILNASNQIHIPHESDFIARAYPFYNNKQSFNEEDYREIVRFFIRTSQNDGWGLTENYLLSYLKEHAPQTFPTVNSAIYEAYLKQEGLENLQWGIKTPVLIANINRILDVYPEAKIIHLVRDGRDVHLSYKKVHLKSQSNAKFGPKGVIQSALYWIDGLRRVEEFHDSSIYELRYEDILTRSEDTLKKLCAFLDIEYDPSMSNQYQDSNKNKDLILPEHKINIHAKIKGGVDSNNTQNYLDNMSKKDRFIFELFSTPYLHQYGYYIEFSWLRSQLFTPLRSLAYFSARQFNNWRYHKRDFRAYKQALLK